LLDVIPHNDGPGIRNLFAVAVALDGSPDIPDGSHIAAHPLLKDFLHTSKLVVFDLGRFRDQGDVVSDHES